MISKIGEVNAFTLIEMLVVLAVISIMFAIGVPFFRASSQRSKLKSAVFKSISFFSYARMLALKNREWIQVALENNTCLHLSKKSGEKWIDLSKSLCAPSGVKFSLTKNIVFYPSGEAEQTLCLNIINDLSQSKKVCVSGLSGKIYCRN